MMGSGSGLRFVRYQLPAILWALLIFLSSSIPGRAFPRVSIPYLDKVVHFVYYFIFAILLARAFRFQSRFVDLAKFGLILSFLLSIAYGVTDEVHQLFVAERSSDPNDLFADTIGALAAVVVLAVVRRRAKKSLEARDKKPEARRVEQKDRGSGLGARD